MFRTPLPWAVTAINASFAVPADNLRYYFLNSTMWCAESLEAGAPALIRAQRAAKLEARERAAPQQVAGDHGANRAGLIAGTTTAAVAVALIAAVVAFVLLRNRKRRRQGASGAAKAKQSGDRGPAEQLLAGTQRQTSATLSVR